MNIPKLLTVAVLLFCVTSMLTFSACSVSNVLSEGEKILSYMPMAVNVALPLVCIDVAICPAAKAAVVTFDAAQAAVLTFFQQWQAASSAASPGILSQLQTAINQLQQAYVSLLTAFHVSNSNIVGVVGSILAAVYASIGQLAQLTGTVLAAGGTKAAARKVFQGALIPGTHSFKLGPVTMTSKDFKNTVLGALKTHTGDSNVDAQLQLLRNQVKGW